MTIDDEPMLTIEEVLELVEACLNAAECMALEDVAADERPALAEWLWQHRAARLATARAMLEHRCTAIH